MHYHTETVRVADLEPGDTIFNEGPRPVRIEWAVSREDRQGPFVALGLGDGTTVELAPDAIARRVPACGLCGELADAEMAEFATGTGSVFGHAGCGLERGMELA